MRNSRAGQSRKYRFTMKRERERKRKAAKKNFCFSFVNFFCSVAFANVVVIDDDVEVEEKSNHKHI